MKRQPRNDGILQNSCAKMNNKVSLSNNFAQHSFLFFLLCTGDNWVINIMIVTLFRADVSGGGMGLNLAKMRHNL